LQLHRVGRTGRGDGKRGKALLFLLPQELGFLKYLQQAKVPLNEYEFPLNKLANVQQQLEKLMSKNYYLHKSAREAYRSYIQAYSQHSLKHVFDVHQLQVQNVAKSFGFDAPPAVQLKVSLKSTKSDKHKINSEQQKQARNGFDANNPYGTNQQGKQWSR
jgi:ATP-dependent RNA helicase DDX18/HAS1